MYKTRSKFLQHVDNSATPTEKRIDIERHRLRLLKKDAAEKANERRAPFFNYLSRPFTCLTAAEKANERRAPFFYRIKKFSE